MDSLLNILSDVHISSYLLSGLCVVTIILLIMLIVILKSLNKLENKYRKLMRGVNGRNLEEMITTYLDKIDAAKKETDEVREMCSKFDNRIKGCLQKVSIVRYKAFDDVGSDLSFSIAMLDDNNNGIIITGIFGRDESTTYAKPIDSGLSRYDLSDEEKQVLQDAMSKK